MIVASVLRSGGDFEPKHVYALQKMCAQYLPPHKFVCLSDVDLNCETIPLLHDWVGWWAKMELFRLPSALYFDLDTVLTGDCTEIVEAAKQHDFVIMRDVYRGKHNPKAMQSSMMYWSKPVDLYDKFAALQMYTAGGDQAYIEHFMRDKVTYWQDIADGIVSFKADVLPKGLDDANVVIFHGKPRPWEQTRVSYEIG
jgi:hypothetical protein